MRREPLSSEYPVHLMRRGARGLPFVRSDADRWRNLQALFYLNDSSARVNWLRELEEERAATERQERRKKHFLHWPDSWPERDPLISLWGFAFVENHDHIIACERKEGGVSKFMQKCGISLAKHFNEKYNEKGAVFQGAYKVKVIDSDQYLKWVVPYVMAKNTFEVHPKGYQWAVRNFEKAWEWGVQYPFSSLGDVAGVRNSPIVDTVRLKAIVGTGKEFKKLCRDMLMGRERIAEMEEGEIAKLAFEE